MWTKLVDMRREPKKDTLYDASPAMAGGDDDYPWGLQITLDSEDLKKLGLDCDCDVGDMIDMRCFAEVKGVSINQGGGEEHSTVRLQIQKIALENEMSEEAPESE